MRIAMTLVVRDEVDIVGTWLDYHLAGDVSLVIATDHRSVDGTSDILREHERDGRVVVLREDDEVLRQAEWVTSMSRLAATEHGADWVIPSDADEFWWPRGGSFATALAAVPSRFGVVRGVMRQFVLRVGSEPFFERMTVRARPTADLSSPYHAQVKIAHRGVRDAVVGVGNHDVEGSGLRLIREWFPFEVLHFPVRSARQLEDKFLRRATSPDGQHIVRALDLLARGEHETLLAETMVDDEALAEGLAEGTLIRDVRLRNALRGLASEGRLPAHRDPTVGDDADLAEDVNVALEHDSAVVAERRCSELERAVAVLEGRAFVASRLARRLRLSAGSADN
jgi:Glycosyl transferase family 2